jgi:hypothetical protein
MLRWKKKIIDGSGVTSNASLSLHITSVFEHTMHLISITNTAKAFMNP